MKKALISKVMVLGALVVLTACGPEFEKIGIGDKDEAKKEGAKKELVAVDISVSQDERQGAAFALAGATGYSVLVEDCASGFSGTVTETTASFDLYKFDQGCVAKLQSFVAYNDTYTAQADNGFSTYAVGEVAVFENSAGTDTLRVKVAAQLSATIGGSDGTGSETVSYSFSEITDGGASSVDEVKGTHTISIAGQAGPNFAVTDITFTGMTGTGAGKFIFNMTCNAAMAGTACSNVDLSDIHYRLIPDTYSDVLTIDDATAIFQADPGSAISAGDQHAVGNGGFNSSELTGPDQMHLNPNMILILEAGGASYQYFNIDVSTISY